MCYTITVYYTYCIAPISNGYILCSWEHLADVRPASGLINKPEVRLTEVGRYLEVDAGVFHPVINR